MLMYKVLIRPVLTYPSETSTLSKTNEGRLSLFKRRVLRFIFGEKQEKETLRERYNYDLYKAFNEQNNVHHYKHQGLGPLIRSASLSNVSSVFQLFSFFVVCSSMIIYCESTIYFRRHSNIMVYLLNCNITYVIILATCFDSYESSSGIKFKNYFTYCFKFFVCKTICTIVLEFNS